MKLLPVKEFKLGYLYMLTKKVENHQLSSMNIEVGDYIIVSSITKSFKRFDGTFENLANKFVKLEGSTYETVLGDWVAENFMEVDMNHLPVDIHNKYVATMKVLPSFFLVRKTDDWTIGYQEET